MKYNSAQALHNLRQFGEFGDVNPSITDSATFTFMAALTMSDTFDGHAEGCYLYSRHWNPMNKYLADAMAALEGTEEGWVTASGMAAITCTILQICSAGDHIVSSETNYGGTYAFLQNWLPRFNIDVTFVNISDIEAVKKAIRPNTKMIYTESMTNPLLQVADIPVLAEIANQHNAKLVVDNTFAPMLISAHKLGAHVVVYSMTKFVNGKNDCVAGAICGSKEFVDSLISVSNGTAMLLGPALEPMRSASILKNLYTLHIRMKQHSKNAMYLAKKFAEIGIRVNYPGLETNKHHETIKRLMNEEFGFGGILSVDMSTVERASVFMESMQDKGVGYLAVSLGYFRTLFSNSGTSTSSEIPEDMRFEMGMSPGLVRFSVGLDNDIEHTFEVIHQILIEKKLI